jgi:hypothetical protein
MVALVFTSLTHICCGNYTAAEAALDQALTLTEEKGASFWQAWAVMARDCVFALTGEASKAWKCSPPGPLHGDQREQQFGCHFSPRI